MLPKQVLIKPSGFQFKQFYVDHSQCAMKVGTDSILLGSWVATNDSQQILDIGTGSGILALMLAQKSAVSSQILGIDIDLSAVTQAKMNGQNSPWPDKISFANTSLQDLKNQGHLNQLFDLIVSNPPYFAVNPTANKQNLATNNQQRMQARQTTTLDHIDLLKSVNVHLSEKGGFYCVLPVDIGEDFIKDAWTLGLYCNQQLKISSITSGKVTRLLLKFSRYQSKEEIKHLTIYSKHKHYSDDYINLCKDFYLRF